MKYTLSFLLCFCSLFFACAQPTPVLDMMRCGNLPIDNASQARFTQLYDQLQGLQEWTVLVDNKHMLPASYRPQDLVIRGPKLQLRREAMERMDEMIDAAQKSGVSLVPISTFRDYQYQQGLIARSRPNNPYIARPGASQHQLGTAIDFNTLDPRDEHIAPLVWLTRHAGEYGFSLSFPKGTEAEAESGYPFEPWHYRYITRPAVQMQDEFFAGSQHRLLVFLNNCWITRPDPQALRHNLQEQLQPQPPQTPAEPKRKTKRAQRRQQRQQNKK